MNRDADRRVEHPKEKAPDRERSIDRQQQRPPDANRDDRPPPSAEYKASQESRRNHLIIMPLPQASHGLS